MKKILLLWTFVFGERCVSECHKGIKARYGKFCGYNYGSAYRTDPCDYFDACCREHDHCLREKDDYLNRVCNDGFVKCFEYGFKSSFE